MVGEFGEVLVMDWGLAKRVDVARHSNVETAPPVTFANPGDAPLGSGMSSYATLQGSVTGTPQYMSPEQAQGRTDELEDKRVRIRDARTLTVQRDFQAHDGIITALAWHPTKPILASASADLTIRLWSPGDGSLIEELRVPSEPQSLSFSPSGKRLASCDAKDVVSIWELGSSETRTP